MSAKASENALGRKPTGFAGVLYSSASLILASVFLLPLLWVISLSLKSNRETLSPALFPESPQPGNYARAWRQFGLGQFFLNSLVVTVFSVGVTVLAAMFAAYGFTKLRFRGSETLFVTLLMGVIIPPAALVVPLLIEMRHLGLYNSRMGLSLVYVALGLPIATLILRGFFDGIPHELVEAARLDRCSETKILFRVLAPLARGGIVTVIILLFLANWNEFILALVSLRDVQKYTLPVGVSSQIGQYTSEYHLIAASSVIASIPVFAIYLALQRQFERGIAEGALKA